MVVANGKKDAPDVWVITPADMTSPTGPPAPALNPIPGPTADGVYVG